MMNLHYVVLCSLVLACACSDPFQESAKPPGECKTALSDDPPAEGMCAGWRKSLAQGIHVDTVEYCLREKALRDRAQAAAEAEVLLGWRIDDEQHPDFKPLLVALTRFPEAGALEQYLSGMSLLPNPPGEYSRLDQALTASDYIGEKGNIYWFDTETGVYPNNHDYLLAEIATLSELKGALFNERPPKVDEYEGEPYLITAEFRGKEYRQLAQNYGDWYDIEAVLMLLNRMAIDNSMEVRFVTLPTGDQTAIVWVVDNEMLSRLQTEGLVQLSEAEISMQTGEAFEAAVLNKFDVNQWRNRGRTKP